VGGQFIDVTLLKWEEIQLRLILAEVKVILSSSAGRYTRKIRNIGSNSICSGQTTSSLQHRPRIGSTGCRRFKFVTVFPCKNIIYCYNRFGVRGHIASAHSRLQLIQLVPWRTRDMRLVGIPCCRCVHA
jgi:hypothetical protein